MKLQARNFVVRKPKTVDITVFFKKFCIATRTKKARKQVLSSLFIMLLAFCPEPVGDPALLLYIGRIKPT